MRSRGHIITKAEKGETTVKVIAALSIICSLMNLVTGDGAFLVRAVACAISIFIAIKLTEGRQWSRILFMLSAGFSLFSAIFSTIAFFVLVGTASAFSIVVTVFYLVLTVGSSAAYVYFMFFNKNVDCFFQKAKMIL